MVGNTYHLFVNQAAAAVSGVYTKSKSDAGLLDQRRFVCVSREALRILVALKLSRKLATFFLLDFPCFSSTLKW